MTSGADGASTNGGNWRTSTATSLHTSTAATAGRPRLRPAHLLRRPAQPQTAKPPSRLCPDTSLPDSPIPRTHPCRFPYGKPAGAPGGGADTRVAPRPPGRPWRVRAPRHDPGPDAPGGQAVWMATFDRLDRTGRVGAGPCRSSRLQNGTRLCNRPGRPEPSRCRSRTSPRKREGWPSSRFRSCFVPVFVPFRSRHHLSWCAAHLALTLRHLAAVAGASFRPNAIDGGGRSHDQGGVGNGRTTRSPGRAARCRTEPDPLIVEGRGPRWPGGNSPAAGRALA